jgi:hypothetical protein
MCSSCRELMKEIHLYRNTLIKTGLKKGLTDPMTIKFSQILDELIFRFQSKCK